jgi:hypothetical protein
MRNIICYGAILAISFSSTGSKAADYEVIPESSSIRGYQYEFQANFFDYKRQNKYLCIATGYINKSDSAHFICQLYPLWKPAKAPNSSHGRWDVTIAQVGAFWQTDPEKGGLEFCISTGGCSGPELWQQWGGHGAPLPAP